MSESTAPARSRRRRPIVLIGSMAVAGALLAVLAFVRLVPAPAGGLTSSEAPAGQGGSNAPGVLTIGAPAPALQGTTLDGRTLSLADLRGKAVVVNFWASWCPPCKREFPAFKSVLARHEAAGLAVVGVLFNDAAAPAQAFVRDQGATWPTLLDPGGSAAKAFTVVAAPETFLVDRSGIVRARMLGDLTESSLEAAIAALLQ